MELGSCASGVVGLNLEAQMAALKDLGYDFIEPAWKLDMAGALGEAFGRELQAQGKRTGCPVRSAIFPVFCDLGKRLRDYGSRARELELLTRACETLAAAGGDVLLLPNWVGDHAPEYDGLYADFLREAGARAARYNVRLGIEHIPSSKYRNLAVSVFELAELSGAPNVGVYYDIANGLYAEDDPVSSARAVASRVVQFHVKDFKKGERPLAAMPLKEVRAIFESAGFRGRAAVELAPREPAGLETNAHLAEALQVLRSAGY